MVRVHDSTFGATEPHPGPDRSHHHGTLWPRSRFAHFRHTLATPWVPSLYGGTDDITAIAETMLRGLDRTTASRPIHVRLGRWRSHVISTIAPNRPLRLLLVDDPALTSTTCTDYATSVGAAAERHATHPDADGLMWTSRHYPAGGACVLWVDEPIVRRRVARAILTVVDQPIPVTSGDGQERLLAAAEALDVMVVASQR